MRPHSRSRLRPSQVELLRSMQEPVDYRMTIRTRDRLFSFRASLKDLKVRCTRLRMSWWQMSACQQTLCRCVRGCSRVAVDGNDQSSDLVLCRYMVLAGTLH